MTSVPSGMAAPVLGEILSGLMVRPDVGTLAVSVDGGAAFFLAPDGSDDASPVKFVRTPGTSDPLTMSPNASGSARVDVVECRFAGDVAIESDSRDLFNPITGGFSPALLAKATQGSVEFRIRAGTPGAGYPGPASGWLPLAIALVPNGATTCDTATFWDVRPLLSDRAIQLGGQLARAVPRSHRRLIGPANTIAGQEAGVRFPVIAGTVDLEYAGRVVGGRLGRGVPGTDAESIDLGAHYAAGFTITQGELAHLYLLFPHNLPRWARYTDAASGQRVPRAPLGIPVLSRVAPTVEGFPSTSIPMPLSVADLAATCDAGLVLFSTPMRDNTEDEIYPIPIVASGDEIWIQEAGAGNIEPAIVSPGNTGCVFRLTPGVHYPPQARSIRLAVRASWNSGGTNGVYPMLFVLTSIATGDGGAARLAVTTTVPVRVENANSGSAEVTVEVPVPMHYPGDPPSHWDVELFHNLHSQAGATQAGFAAGIVAYRVA